MGVGWGGEIRNFHPVPIKTNQHGLDFQLGNSDRSLQPGIQQVTSNPRGCSQCERCTVFLINHSGCIQYINQYADISTDLANSTPLSH